MKTKTLRQWIGMLGRPEKLKTMLGLTPAAPTQWRAELRKRHKRERRARRLNHYA